MRNGTQVALAVGAGYLMGRRRKMRMAAIMGVAAMTGIGGGLTGQLLRRGAKLIGSSDVLGKISPQLGEVTDMIRGDLIDAGKSAAMAAMTSRIDSISDGLRDRTEALQRHGDTVQGGLRKVTKATGLEDEEGEEEGGEQPVDEAEPAGSRRAPRQSRHGGNGAPPESDEDEEERPARARSGVARAARAASSASPVRRTRR